MAPAANEAPDGAKSSAEIESEHFSPYRADGKLVRSSTVELAKAELTMWDSTVLSV